MPVGRPTRSRLLGLSFVVTTLASSGASAAGAPVVPMGLMERASVASPPSIPRRAADTNQNTTTTTTTTTRPGVKATAVGETARITADLQEILSFSEETNTDVVAGLAEEDYLHSAVERDTQRKRLKKLSGKLTTLMTQLDQARGRLKQWSASEYTMLDHTRLGDPLLGHTLEDGAARQVYVGAAIGRDVRIVEELRVLEEERVSVEESIADAKKKLTELDQAVAEKRARALNVAQDTMRAAQIMLVDPELVEHAIDYPRGTPHGVKIAVEAAMSQIGVKYRFAASKPGVAFDCSGLTLWAAGQAGVVLSHSSRSQSQQTKPVRREDLRIGDLVFYGSPIHHVALYLGNDIVIQAPNEGRKVQYASINSWSGVKTYGRIDFDEAPLQIRNRAGKM